MDGWKEGREGGREEERMSIIIIIFVILELRIYRFFFLIFWNYLMFLEVLIY